MDKDFVFFFSESGANLGYYGGEWHKFKGDGDHFPNFYTRTYGSQ